MLAQRHPVALWGFALVLVLAEASDAIEQEPPRPPGFTLSLELSDANLSETHFELGLISLPIFDSGAEWWPTPRRQALELESSGTSPVADPAALVDFQEELEAQRWPDGKTRMEVHLRTELLHQMSGGTVGYYQDGALFDVGGLVRWFKKIRKSARGRKLPAGSRIDRNQRLILHVHEDDGSAPASISILPLTLGWVDDVLVASCDPSGRCVVDGLPAADCTLLIRGTGAALTWFSPGRDPLRLILKRNGIVKLRPAPDSTEALRVRTTHAPTGLVVPVIRWLNPDRGEWVDIPPSGIPLLLPEGSYTFEWIGGSNPTRSSTIQLEPEVTHDFVLK